MAVLTVNKLSKNYGNVKALKEVSFSVPQGTVFGVLGPNGSGKTTLLGIVMDVLRPTSGSFQMFNDTPNENHRKKIGTLLETPNFYHYLSGKKNLEIAASIKGRGHEDIERVLSVVNLSQRKDSKFSTYSLGMKQRLAIASALLGDPEVLVLDEPTNGLDPVGIAEIRELIKTLHKDGKTILMASHLLDEVEKVCTHVAILKKGELITHGSVEEIFVHNDLVEVEASDIETLRKVLSSFPGLIELKDTGKGFIAAFPPGLTDLAVINKHCFNNGIVLSKLSLNKRSLESKFFELTN